MNQPMAIQLRRVRGFKMPPNTIIVSRRPDTPWGNPYHGDGPDGRCDGHFDRARVTGLFRELINRPDRAELRARARRELAGFNLACWCPLCPAHEAGRPFDVRCPDCDEAGPCHRDVWLEVANGSEQAATAETVLQVRFGPPSRYTRGAIMVRVEGERLTGVETDLPLEISATCDVGDRQAYRVRYGDKKLTVLRVEWERATREPHLKGFLE